MPSKATPCPFCGSLELNKHHTAGTIIHPHYYIECDDCLARTGGTDSGDHWEQWNTRATPQPTRTVLPGFDRARTTDNDAGPHISAAGGDYDGE